MWYRILKSYATFSLLALAAALFVACASGSEADEQGSLVIYAARNENLVGPLFEQFEQLTSINVQVKYGSTAELAATLNEEGKNSPADVFYTRDPGGLGAVSGLLTTLPDDILVRVPEWARSPERKWIGTTARVRAVVYNTDALAEEDLPDSIEGFTDPKWRGRIGWSPTSGPTQTMLTAMRVIWGEDKARAWLEGIKANDPIYYLNHTATVAGVGSGEADVGFVNHYYLLRFLEENGDGFPARNYFLRDGGPGNLVMIVGAGILGTSKNRANAEEFLRFLVTVDAQRYLTEQAFDYPLVEGAKTNPILTPLSEIEHPEIDQALLGDIKGTEALLRDVGIIP